VASERQSDKSPNATGVQYDRRDAYPGFCASWGDTQGIESKRETVAALYERRSEFGQFEFVT
jgi:hypothetical protein